MPKSKKQLFKSNSNKVLSGVFGGVGNYFGVDPVLIRVLFVLATAFTGFVPGVVCYIVLAMVVPEKN